MENKINKMLDIFARGLVGTLCKRVEVLEKEKALTSSLYKALAKELIYESTRNLKALLDVYINIGTVKFISDKNSKKE
jgi:hypothetical protein